jgi:phosphatidylinositol-bisphosphatase
MSLESQAKDTPEKNEGLVDAKNLKIGIITWNMAERSPTLSDCEFINNYHDCDLIALGLQECEDIRPRRREGGRSRKWRQLREKYLSKDQYICVGEKRMGGLNLAMYVRKPLRNLIKNIKVAEIPCGVGNILSNKGAVCLILELVNKKSIAFINAHLAAHQQMVKVRNANYFRIVRYLRDSVLNDRKFPNERDRQLGNRRIRSNGIFIRRVAKAKPNLLNTLGAVVSKKVPIVQSARSLPIKVNSRRETSVPSLNDTFDVAFFFGDLNYRMNLPTLMIESFCDSYGYPDLENDNVEPDDIAVSSQNLKIKNLVFNSGPNNSVSIQENLKPLLQFDQLTREKNRGRAFSHFEEMAINFPPTFKYDKRSPTFDSKKGRSPAWTDRILFLSQKASFRNKESADQCDDVLHPLLYECFDVRSSDHRPVAAKFDYVFGQPIEVPSHRVRITKRVSKSVSLGRRNTKSL